jgi:hypothetical protein
MLHGKKMMLVPHETLEQVQTEYPSAPMPAGSYSKMDADMVKILNDKSLSDFDKWTQYDSVLQRYMSKLSRQKRDVLLTIKEDEEDMQPVKQQSKQQLKDENIQGVDKKADNHNFVADFASNIKNVKALLLYNILKKSAQVLISPDGQLFIESNNVGTVADLITATQKPKLETKPEGWGVFCTYLKNINLPSSYVANNDLKRYLKSKATDKFVIPRRGRSQKTLKWAPYNGPN